MYSLINLAGLAVGFACCIIIYLFISDELSYDKFHNNSGRMYRLSAAYMRQGQWEPYASNAWKTAETVKTNYSEIEQLVRLRPDDNTLFEYGDKRIVEDHFAWVDENFLDVFNFPLTQGSAKDALRGPNKAVISESTAAKYFGTEIAIGKAFKLSDYPIEIQVTGVMKDMPSNSHFHFDILISGETSRQVVPEEMFTNVGWDSQYVYLLLKEGEDAARMEATFTGFIDKNLDPFNHDNFKLFLQPLESIHLRSNIGTELEANGSRQRVIIFSIIAVFILIIACVNYMNLTTARALRRAKEVSMRKVLGAKKPDLLGQFLTESFIMTTVAILVAVLICFFLLPQFNEFAGKAIPRSVFLVPAVAIGLLITMVVIALVSGFYPAMMLSSFRQVGSMKGGSVSGGKFGIAFRKGLVMFQFVISIGLIASSSIVFEQWTYMKNKDLGINRDQVVVMSLQTMDRRQVQTFANELLSAPQITRVGFSNMRMPGWIGNSTNYRAQDVDADEEANKSMKLVRVDYDFFTTVEGQMVEGRNFSRDFPVDTISSIILNESALAQLGWKEGVGKWFELGRTRFNVIGVVKDFHFESVHRKIPPTIFAFTPRRLNWAYVKVDGGGVAEALTHMEETYSKYVTNRDFSYSFLDEDVERQYQAEEKFTQVFTMFTGLAIMIACLGTFGLISFSAERKAKEIGIRKVLGASVGNVSFLLVREFLLLLIMASVIASPVAYYFLNDWISGFNYHATIGMMPFVVATVLAIVIVLLTTGFRALKAAMTNPVDSLRDE
jgi:putative ABC transport system permease protein